MSIAELFRNRRRKERDRLRDKKWEGIVAIEAQRDAAQAKCAELEKTLTVVNGKLAEALEHIANARALLTPTQQASAWRPIETAPRKKVLLRIQTSPNAFRTVEALWINGQWDFEGMLSFKPVGWQPLPAPPEEKRP